MADPFPDPIDPDAALMVAFQKGDETAFAKLLDKYQNIIVNFIYKFVNNLAEAEELAQEVFLRVYRARGSYEPRAKFTSWIYRIAKNISLKALGRKRLSPIQAGGSGGERPDAGSSYPDQRPTPEAQMVALETGRIIRDSINSLPKKEKLAVILRRYEELSYREIADVMGCTEAAVKTYIHRGKLHLRESIREYLENGSI